MAASKNKGFTMQIPECPVCMEVMHAPIFQCKVGHSLCSVCTSHLAPPICPICRQDITDMRNFQLEELIANVKIACPNKGAGCVYVIPASTLDNHLKECIFRSLECPLGVIFGKCSWTGVLKDIMAHCNERHAMHCKINIDKEVELNYINVNEDKSIVFVTKQSKFIFLITFKINTLQNMAYWIVQIIGPKKIAQQFLYEIELNSLQDTKRKIVFREHCFSYDMKAEKITRLGKCTMVPLNALKHFVKDKKLAFRFSLMKSDDANFDKNKNMKQPPLKNDSQCTSCQKKPTGPQQKKNSDKK